MRIGIFDPYLDTLSGGEKYMLSIATCLASDNEVFIFWDNDEEEIRQKALRKLGIDLSKIKFSKNIFYSKVSLLDRLIASLRYDKIIYLSDGSIPFVLSKLYIHFQFPIELIDKIPLKTKFKLKKVDKVFCNSLFTKRYIDKKLGISSTVLYPPVFINNTNALGKENIILHVGRFGLSVEGVNYKKQDVMINMFKKMIDQGLKDWQFMLAIGSKKEDENKLRQLKRMADGYPITIINNPSNDILREQYSRAKIYWHASGFGEDLQKHPERAEHFGISTVEAMGSGAVPVVIKAGGQTEIIDNGKNGFLWDTEGEFIEKTNELIKNASLWEKLSKAAIGKSKVFTGDRFCKELKEIINK